MAKTWGGGDRHANGHGRSHKFHELKKSKMMTCVTSLMFS
jgi:hypothetical protein